MKHYDFLVVGAGLFGAMFAYRASKAGKKCLIIDKRSHLGGNIYCEEIKGINVHKYGAHIFHTSNKKVWDFVNSIVEFNRYTNAPIANYHGKQYNLPFNMNTFYQMWGVLTPEEAKKKIEDQKADAMASMIDAGVKEPRNLEEQALMLIGKDVYETLIKGYTEKQWGRRCSDLPAFIIRRLPVRFVYDNNYFNDLYQGIPIGGYNKLIDGLLSESDTMVDVDFFTQSLEHLTASSEPLAKTWNRIADKLVYTGPIDKFFHFEFGPLDWRTVRFEEEVLNIPNYQGNAVMNFTDSETPYTRIIEHKHFEMFGQAVYDCPFTVISREYSMEYKVGLEPYYTVNDEHNNQRAAQYRELASLEQNVIFGGRLAEYKYYDMAPIVEKVLEMQIE